MRWAAQPATLPLRHVMRGCLSCPTAASLQAAPPLMGAWLGHRTLLDGSVAHSMGAMVHPPIHAGQKLGKPALQCVWLYSHVLTSPGLATQASALQME